MTHSRAHIFRSAWRIAHAGARRYGGHARAFFRAALRLAWSRARNIVNKITHATRKLLTHAIALITFLLRHSRTDKPVPERKERSCTQPLSTAFAKWRANIVALGTCSKPPIASNVQHSLNTVKS